MGCSFPVLAACYCRMVLIVFCECVELLTFLSLLGCDSVWGLKLLGASLSLILACLGGLVAGDGLVDLLLVAGVCRRGCLSIAFGIGSLKM